MGGGAQKLEAVPPWDAFLNLAIKSCSAVPGLLSLYPLRSKFQDCPHVTHGHA